MYNIPTQTVPVPTVSFIPPSHGFFVGSSPNFTCVVQYNDTVDIPLDVTILSTSHSSPVARKSYTQYSRMFALEPVQASDSGSVFGCTVIATGYSPFILPQQETRALYTLQICE